MLISALQFFWYGGALELILQISRKPCLIHLIRTVRIKRFGFKTNPNSSGGYSNLGARGKNFQKLMLSEKKKRSDLGLHIFLPKSKCSLKKKKKVFTSISSLISLFFSQNQGALQKKKVFTSISSLISLFFSQNQGVL